MFSLCECFGAKTYIVPACFISLFYATSYVPVYGEDMMMVMVTFQSVLLTII